MLINVPSRLGNVPACEQLLMVGRAAGGNDQPRDAMDHRANTQWGWGGCSISRAEFAQLNRNWHRAAGSHLQPFVHKACATPVASTGQQQCSADRHKQQHFEKNETISGSCGDVVNARPRYFVLISYV